MVDKLSDLFKDVKEKKIFVLTGAGMSTDSGIPDFRGSAGLHTKIPIEVVLSRDYFFRHTEEFYKVYRQFFLLKAEPNEGHYILAELEKGGFISCIATQNIDGFHTEAGSKNVFELHGTVKKNYCLYCGTFYDVDYIVNYPEIVPKCEKCKGTIKPDVVLYGESIKYYDEAFKHFIQSNIVMVLGSSLSVYPAAGFAQINPFKQKLIIINYDETPFDYKAEVVIRGNITENLRIIKNILLN